MVRQTGRPGAANFRVSDVPTRLHGPQAKVVAARTHHACNGSVQWGA